VPPTGPASAPGIAPGIAQREALGLAPIAHAESPGPPRDVHAPMALRLTDTRGQTMGDLGVDWASVDRMNLGSVSVVNLGSRWGMAVSSGQDRLEECEPTLALTQHSPGFSDTFVFVTATYRLSAWAHLMGSVAGVRIQDQALSEAVDDAEFSSATIGVYFQF